MNEFKSWNSYTHFANRVRREARFIRTSEDDDFLREVLRTSKSRIKTLPAETGLYRAQLGHDWRPLHQDDRYIDEIPAAHPPARMKPQEGRATEGRANPKGIPVLYLATHPQTAMSEVRPWLGSLISCAHFNTIRELKIGDFSVCHRRGIVFYFNEPDASERETAVWTQIDQAFSKPTTPANDTAEYVPTQVIAELFKREGCDGVAYGSAFGDDGHNIVLFDPADAELTSCTLFEAKSLEFKFEQFDNAYWVEKGDATKTNSGEHAGSRPQPEDTEP